MIRFPTTAEQALADAVELDGVYRAGGTDLQERRQHLVVHGQRAPLVDLRDLAGLTQVEEDPAGVWIGGLITLSNLANDPTLRARWPGVAEAAGALATPQIRTVATLAGNLVQAPRCWYHRHPEYTCLRRGGATCYAREGDHLFHVCFDSGPCVAPHPSTMGLALLAYDAELEVLVPSQPEPKRLAIGDALAIDALEPHALITRIRLGAAIPAETAYVRASNRELAEWALVEVMVVVVIGDDGRIALARVTAGGVANTPIRLPKVEAALQGHAPEYDHLQHAASFASHGGKPLAMTEYKLALLDGCVLEALARALL